MLGGGDKSSQPQDISSAQELVGKLDFKVLLDKTMTNKINVQDLSDFDLAEHLKTDEGIAIYLSLILESDDYAELTYALGVVAKARGMTDVARAAGLTREALYKALRPNSQPRFDTVARVCRALGLKLTTQVQT